MLKGFVGQADRVEALEASLQAHASLGRKLPNMLLLGNAGRGKTKLAHEIGNATNQRVVTLHAPSIIDREQVIDKIKEASGSILFIDEIHTLPRMLAEDLYSVVDDNQISVEAPKVTTKLEQRYLLMKEALPLELRKQWKGIGTYWVPVYYKSKETQSSIQPIENGITVIGATTDEALLPSAFLSRLSQLKVYLRQYTDVELAAIAVLHADATEINIDNDTALFLAGRSRATPRRVLQLIDRAADFAAPSSTITLKVAQKAVRALGVDAYGLEEPHRAILRILADGPISRTGLGQRLGLTPTNLTHYFGDLLEQGLVKVTSKQEITEKGVSALEGEKE